MRKVVLYIAMSLDGYIADSDGKVDWLEGHGSDNTDIDSYSEFIKNIDTVILGFKTYDQIVTELSPDKWFYEQLTVYVVTHKKLESSENIIFTDTAPAELIKKLRRENGKDIWICGGADIARQLREEIDCYYITVIPTLLGSGIPLFESGGKEKKLKLVKTRSYNGMTALVYEPRR